MVLVVQKFEEQTRGIPDGGGRSQSGRYATTEDPSRPIQVFRELSRFGTRPWIMAADIVIIGSTIALGGSDIIPAVFTGVVFAVLAAAAGMYRSRLNHSALDDAPGLVGRLFIASTVVYALSENGTGSVALLGDGLGRPWWTSVALAAFVLVSCRAVLYHIIRIGRRKGWAGHRTLIVGSGEIGTELATFLLRHPAYGLRPVGFHDPFPKEQSIDALPVYKQNLSDSIRELRASAVVIAFVAMPDSELVRHVYAHHQDTAEFFYVPRLHEVSSGRGRDVEMVRGLPLIRLRRAPHRSVMWQAKAILDRIFALGGLVVLSPLLLLLSAAVLFSLGRPILFRQERVGLHGARFEIIKFRSLPTATIAESDTAWAASKARNPSRVGRFLRATSFDELPQLWNILCGNMSFVGPRPERPHFVDEFTSTYPFYNSRHRVPSGLTGLAQVNGLRGDTSISERTAFDNRYIETWSLWEDLKILIRTAGSVLVRRGE